MILLLHTSYTKTAKACQGDIETLYNNLSIESPYFLGGFFLKKKSQFFKFKVLDSWFTGFIYHISFCEKGSFIWYVTALSTLFVLMPRIPTSYILRAYQQDPLLPLLLQECRTLDSAQNELRWLREWAVQKFYQRTSRFGAGTHRSTPGWRSHLRSMCRERARGVPLQYLLGDQPFGDLEIICKKGVLIPRYAPYGYTIFP